MTTAAPPTPSNVTHTLAVGKTVSSKYGSFGGYTGPSRPDPRRQTMVLMARSGRGKSTFTHSIEGAFVINADGTSTGVHTKAEVWPYVRRDGMPVEQGASNGKPLTLTWQHIKDKIAQLIDAAKTGAPRPEVIVFDTIDRCYQLVQQWMVDEYNRVQSDPKKHKEAFGDLFGQTAWPLSYAHVMEAVRDLRGAGYGVICLCQFGDKTVYINDQKILRENVHQLPDNLWLSLRDYCETVALITTDDRSETPMIEQKNPDGTPRMRGGIVDKRPGKPQTTRTFRLTFSRKENDDLKARNPIADLVLGKMVIKDDNTVEIDQTIGAPWPLYEAAYIEANQKTT